MSYVYFQLIAANTFELFQCVIWPEGSEISLLEKTSDDRALVNVLYCSIIHRFIDYES